MKANRWFELEYAFVDTDGVGGEAYVQLCDHSVKGSGDGWGCREYTAGL
jgi:hypothetical protein